MKSTSLQNLAVHAEQYQKFETEQVMTWCGGCGNYGIQNALKRALTLEGLGAEDFIYCFDVGCSGNGSDKIHANTIHGLHGRVLPLASGVKVANHKLKVVAGAGDGATFSEGVGHLVHAVRNDYPVVFLHHDNQNYALTTGQASSLTPAGCKRSATPYGEAWGETINPLQMVLSLKPSWVGRSLSADTDHLTELLRAALRHEGFAFVEILQSCPTYNREMGNKWFLERVKDVSTIAGYDPTDIWAARRLAEMPYDEGIYTGVLYHNPQRENFLEVVPQREFGDSVLVDEVRHYDIGQEMAAMKP